MFRLISIIFTILLINSCSYSTYKLKPIVEKNTKTKVIYLEGLPFIVSEKKNSLIMIYGEKTSKSDIALYLLVLNKSKERPVNIFPDSIKFLGRNRYKKYKEFKIYSAKEYLNKIKKKQYWRKFFVALSDAFEETSATMSTSYTSGYINTPEGYAYVDVNTTTYDESKAAKVREQNKKEFQAMSNIFERENRLIYNSLLKSTTIFPERYIIGIVMVKEDKQFTDKFVIKIPIGNESHIIIFKPLKYAN